MTNTKASRISMMKFNRRIIPFQLLIILGILDAGCSILDNRYSIQDPGFGKNNDIIPNLASRIIYQSSSIQYREPRFTSAVLSGVPSHTVQILQG